MIKGPMALLDGMRLLMTEKDLRVVLWKILGLLLVLLVIVTGGVFWLSGYLAGLWLPTGDAWYIQLLIWLVWLFSFAIAVITGIVSFTTLGSAAAAPWLDELAARTEGLSGAQVQVSQDSWAAQIMTALAHSIRPLLGLLPYGIGALLVIWIPVIGQILATAIWGYGAIRYLNYELMDTPASRRSWNFAQRKGELVEKRWYYIAFGGAAMGLMLVPLVNLLVVPAATVALSREWLER